MLLGEPYLLAFSCFTIGLILGTVFYRCDFCIAGILRDVFMFRSHTLLPPLLLGLVLTAFLFLVARAAGILPYDPPPSYGDSATLLAIAGGLIFGVGMVLAGGCVVGTLYKMGGGNLTSVIAFVGIIAGSLLYAEIHPWVKEFSDRLVFSHHVTLTQAWPRAGNLFAWGVVIASIPFFLRWYRHRQPALPVAAEGYIQPWQVAVVLAVANLSFYLVAGWPFGISTAYAKIGAFMQFLVAPGHTGQLAYFIDPSLTVPTADGVLTGGAGPRVDLIFITELMLLLGIIAGSFINAVALREFRFHGPPPKWQGIASFGGGILIALGARIAGGCNIKFVLGGLPLFSFQAMLFVVGMLVGAWLGARLLPIIILRGRS